MDVPKNILRIDSIAIAACLLIGVALRLFIITSRFEQLTQDRDAYLGIATSLTAGRGYSSPGSETPTAFRPPLYPLILAVGIRFASPAVAVASINVLSGILCIGLTLDLGARLGLTWRRYIAAMLVALDPLLIAYTPQPMTEALCTSVAAVWLWVLIRQSTADSECGLGSSFYIGIAFGLLVLCRPTFWLIVPCYCLYCLLSLSWRWASLTIFELKHRMSHLTVSGCGALLVVIPWVIRNWLVFGVPILTTTHGGYTLLLGNNPVFYQEVVKQPWGTVWNGGSLSKWQSDLETQMGRELRSDATEIERDNWHSQQAKRTIADNPQLFMMAVIHRIRSLWNTVPQAEAANGVNPITLSAVRCFYTLELLSACLGLLLVLQSKDRDRWVPLYILIVSVQLAHLFYWTNARMRAPLTPAIALFSVAAVRNRQPPK